MLNRLKTFSLLQIALLLSVLSVVIATVYPAVFTKPVQAEKAAIRNRLIDIQTDIAIATASIALKERGKKTPKYPTLKEMQSGMFDESHPALKGKTVLGTKLSLDWDYDEKTGEVKTRKN